jgi:hypothetical protein
MWQRRMTFFLLKFSSGLVLSFICYLDSFDRALMKVEPFPLLSSLLSLATLLALMFSWRKTSIGLQWLYFPSFIPFQYLWTFWYLPSPQLSLDRIALLPWIEDKRSRAHGQNRLWPRYCLFLTFGLWCTSGYVHISRMIFPFTFHAHCRYSLFVKLSLIGHYSSEATHQVQGVWWQLAVL